MKGTDGQFYVDVVYTDSIGEQLTRAEGSIFRICLGQWLGDQQRFLLQPSRRCGASRRPDEGIG